MMYSVKPNNTYFIIIVFMQIILEQKRIQKRGDKTEIANVINCDNNHIRNNGYLYNTDKL